MSKLVQKVLFAAVILTLALGLLAPVVAATLTLQTTQPSLVHPTVDSLQSGQYPHLAGDLFPFKPSPGVLPCGYTWAG